MPGRDRNPDPDRRAVRRPPAGRLVVENLLVLAVLALAAVLQAASPDLYYRSLQEDEALEWATFWAFAAAAGLAVAAAVRSRRAGGGVPWFPLGVGAFCAFVALEEISWGQRLLGYRPPVYFLEHNFQQELNFHNVVETGLRKAALAAVILGYGVALPLLGRFRAVAGLCRRLGVTPPPLGLAPGFLATGLVYLIYPWRFTGEVVELMLGLGFLFAQLEGTAGPARRRGITVPVGAWLAVGLLGAATAWGSRLALAGRPGMVEAARAETAALGRDFAAAAPTRCGIHKRVYTFVEEYEELALLAGEFTALTARGLPEERAAFFLDPWNSPYWIRHRCDDAGGAERVFVYSFGPDRRRGSTAWAVAGDDVGAGIYARGEPPGGEPESADEE